MNTASTGKYQSICVEVVYNTIQHFRMEILVKYVFQVIYFKNYIWYQRKVPMQMLKHLNYGANDDNNDS